MTAFPDRYTSVQPLHGHVTPRWKTWAAAFMMALYRGAAVIALWRERSRSRRQLSLLDDAMLKDIGLSRADVYQEVTKPFWRA